MQNSEYDISRKQYGLELNPFRPNAPATEDIFVGRELEKKMITDSLYRTYKGQAEHVLIKGDRGIGKTSLAMMAETLAIFASDILKNQDIKYFTVFNSLGTTNSVEEVCIKILECCYKKLKESQNKIYNKIVEALKNIRGFSVGDFGIQFDFKENPKNVSLNFNNLIENFWNNIKDKYSTMLIIVDETDSISQDSNFSPFFKSLIETLGHDKFNNIEFIFTVTPMGLNNLIKSHEAFPRLFKSIEISNLSEIESNKLTMNALRMGVPRRTAQKDFLKRVYEYSDGIPCFVHEICYAAFEVCNSRVLSNRDFVRGVLGTSIVRGAKDSIFDKHFRQKYTQEILSNTYREILHIMSSFNKIEIKASEIIKKFGGKKHTCQTYLSRMVQRGILKKPEGKMGYYYIPENMFRLWLRFSEITEKYLREK